MRVVVLQRWMAGTRNDLSDLFVLSLTLFIMIALSVLSLGQICLIIIFL